MLDEAVVRRARHVCEGERTPCSHQPLQVRGEAQTRAWGSLVFLVRLVVELHRKLVRHVVHLAFGRHAKVDQHSGNGFRLALLQQTLEGDLAGPLQIVLVGRVILGGLVLFDFFFDLFFVRSCVCVTMSKA